MERPARRRKKRCQETRKCETIGAANCSKFARCAIAVNGARLQPAKNAQFCRASSCLLAAICLKIFVLPARALRSKGERQIGKRSAAAAASMRQHLGNMTKKMLNASFELFFGFPPARHKKIPPPFKRTRAQLRAKNPSGCVSARAQFLTRRQANGAAARTFKMCARALTCGAELVPRRCRFV